MWYIYNGILHTHEKEWHLAICEKMDWTWGHYAKWNNTEKDKYCMISLTCGSLRKKKRKNKFIDIESRLMDARGGNGGQMGEEGQKVKKKNWCKIGIYMHIYIYTYFYIY